MSETQKFTGKVLSFTLGGTNRKYIVGAMRYGYIRKFTVSEPFNAKTGQGEQRAVIESHAKQLKKTMVNGTFVPTTFSLGTRQHHRDEIEINDGIATLVVSEDNKLPMLDGNNRSFALELIRSEDALTEKVIDNLYIPYILYINGNTREDFIALQAGKPVSRAHMLSVRIATGLIDEKHAPYFSIAKDTAQILHTTKDSFCHNLIQSDSNGAKLPLSLNSLCSKGASDLAFSLYGGAKIAHNYTDDKGISKDGVWLSECILTAFRAIQRDNKASYLLERGNILAPIPDGTKAGTSMIIGIGNMLAARLMLKQTEEPEDSDIQLLVDCAVDNFSVQTRGNTSADRKRELFKGFASDFFSDLIINSDDKPDYDDIPAKTVGGHEGIPVVIIRLLSPSTFNVSKIPSERKKRGRPSKVVVSNIESYDEDIEVDVDEARVSDEDPIDAEAFAEDDAITRNSIQSFDDDDDESAPWDDDIPL